MKKTTSIFLLAAMAIASITCKKTPDTPTGGNKIEALQDLEWKQF